jgi:hypothetical protein
MLYLYLAGMCEEGSIWRDIKMMFKKSVAMVSPKKARL